MKKIVLTYGLIAGVISCLAMIITLIIGLDCVDGIWGMVLGFTGMIIAFSFIFVAVNKYRERHGDGAISFGKAFLIGLLISVIASTVYVSAWTFEHSFFVPDFMEKYSAGTIKQMQDSGVSADVIAETQKEFDVMIENYKNPVYVFFSTYQEILPVGILASLLAAIILRRNRQTPLANM